MAETTPAITAVEGRRQAQKAAILAAIGVVEKFDAIGGFGTDETDALVELHEPAYDALRAVAESFGPRVKGGPKERVTLEKADPADVAAFFASTGLTRKELASAAEVSTSVIATVQNEKGDRWSAVTFEAKKAKVLAWVEAHAAEIDARKAADAKAAADRDAAVAAKAQRAAAKSAPAPKAAATPKVSAKAAATSGKKAGRPDKAARAANRKPTTSQVAAAAPA